MERGEVAIVSAQFLALAVLILLLGNYGNVTGKGITNAEVNSVFWGTPSQGVALKSGVLNLETTNASTISLYFSLPPGTDVSLPVTASRLCLDPTANNTGKVRVYTNITISYDSTVKKNYIVIGPTGQPTGIGCLYTITLTDTLQQTATWTATVKLTNGTAS